MKALAFQVREFAVAGEFGATLIPGPVFTGVQQLAGNPLTPQRFLDIDSFKITDRTGFRAFHIIMAELALRKTGCPAVLPIQKNSGDIIRKH